MTPSVDVDLQHATRACPKSMTYGPCGGVGDDGTCEVAPVPCSFLPLPTVRWSGARESRTVPEPHLLALMRQRPVVVADLPAVALSRDSLERAADRAVGAVDAVLLGDHGAARVQFSPSYRASLVQARGVPVWQGLNCRDHNRVALEGELAGLADLGVGAVHCVTGDHTLTGDRPDAQPVFDLDSTALAAAMPARRGSGADSMPARYPAGSRRLVNRRSWAADPGSVATATQATKGTSTPRSPASSTKARSASTEPAWFTKQTSAPARTFSRSRSARRCAGRSGPVPTSAS